MHKLKLPISLSLVVNSGKLKKMLWNKNPNVLLFSQPIAECTRYPYSSWIININIINVSWNFEIGSKYTEINHCTQQVRLSELKSDTLIVKQELLCS